MLHGFNSGESSRNHFKELVMCCKNSALQQSHAIYILFLFSAIHCLGAQCIPVGAQSIAVVA